MSLRSAMYSSVTGLNSHSTAISTVGNNLANSNTVGFKSQRADFQDIFYSSINTANGIGQIGHGAMISQIMTNFNQGPYETTTNATDVAISGRGFFKLRDRNYPDKNYYTRAGNFKFNKLGVLTDPSGNIVQGWRVQPGSDSGKPNTIGSITDIKLDKFQSPPQATQKVSLSTNLNAKATDKSVNSANPFFSMFSQWNGTSKPPLGSSKYSYQDTLKVYDANGGAHDLTVHFDRVGDPVASTAGGKVNWEFTVSVPPGEDGRILGGTKIGNTSAGGMLMTGTLTFSPSGQMEGMTAFTLKKTATGNLKNMINWEPARLSFNGLPQLTANFLGQDNASFSGDTKANLIEIDLGIRNKDGATTWSNPAITDASMIGNTQASLMNLGTPDVDANASTSNTSSSSTQSKTQDGYTSGQLQNISINTDGVVIGRYSNGQILDLFVLGLAKFSNKNGLSRLGGNLFSETRESGAAITGKANTGGLGKVNSNSLEQSNVDPGREMVRLITLQRGFQANSKVITTSDQMMGELINLKR
ncbi:MAG: flagellar hook protein FlgE [Desulfovibrio sp.]